MKDALFCLINAERAAKGVRPVRIYVGLRGSRAVVLSTIAQGHADAGASIRWWGKRQTYRDSTGKDCTFVVFNGVEYCDSHVNPETGSTIESRIKEPRYCGTPRTLRKWAENTFTGAGVAGYAFDAFVRGDQLSTPRAAVKWWMWSRGHRENLLNPDFAEVGIGIAPVSASPDVSATFTPSGTYVTDYATCS